jgi:hypothetical protein
MTQSRKDALQDSLAKVEAGEAADKFGSMRAYWCADMQVDAMRAYSGSLDAAHDLHEAVLPGWDWIVTNDASHAGEGDGPMAAVAPLGTSDDYFKSSSTNPARAWLIAVLKALIAEADKSITAETIAELSATHADALRRLGDE